MYRSGLGVLTRRSNVIIELVPRFSAPLDDVSGAWTDAGDGQTVRSHWFLSSVNQLNSESDLP
jgi:hypothetical protein